ncbi:hypothetical protein MJK71_20745 [Escherichia coli]|nr:hypothetical protein MJK71_20745 [Escherichia coli]
MDIGGGTANYALFDAGKRQRHCLPQRRWSPAGNRQLTGAWFTLINRGR